MLPPQISDEFLESWSVDPVVWPCLSSAEERTTNHQVSAVMTEQKLYNDKFLSTHIIWILSHQRRNIIRSYCCGRELFPLTVRKPRFDSKPGSCCVAFACFIWTLVSQRRPSREGSGLVLLDMWILWLRNHRNKLCEALEYESLSLRGKSFGVLIKIVH